MAAMVNLLATGIIARCILINFQMMGLKCPLLGSAEKRLSKPLPFVHCVASGRGGSPPLLTSAHSLAVDTRICWSKSNLSVQEVNASKADFLDTRRICAGERFARAGTLAKKTRVTEQTSAALDVSHALKAQN
jgi:hypothetical protein